MLARIVALLVVSAATTTTLASPLTFRHTGRLLDAAGAPLNGEVTLTISLSETNGGAAFWSQTYTDLQVDGGYFAVEVGDGPPALTPDDFERGELWLTTTFGGTSTPPQRILAVPYAMRAAEADNVVGDGAIVQVQTVQTRQQGTYSASNSGTGSAISPLDITITPKKAGNEIILEWTVGGELTYNAGFVVTRNGSYLPNATNGSNSRWAVTAASDYDNNDSSTPNSYTVRIIDTNSLATRTTYRVHARSSEGSNHTFYLNRTFSSGGSDAYEALLSVGTAMEVWRD